MSFVPDTTTFKLTEVINAVTGAANNLQSCVDNAVSGYYDPRYSSSTGMLKFRNYGNAGEPAFIYLNESHALADGESTELTMPLTISASADLLVVTINIPAEQYRETNTPTWNGSSMTQVNSFNGSNYAEMWYMINPTTGSHNLVIGNNTKVTPMGAIASWYSGNGGKVTFKTYNNATQIDAMNNNISVTCTISNNEEYLIIDSLTTHGSNGYTNHSDNVIQVITADLAGHISSQYGTFKSTGTSRTISWQFLIDGGNWYDVAAVFKTATDLPTVTTNTTINILSDRATGRGEVTDAGNKTGIVDDRGVCWSDSNSDPTIADNTASAGSGTTGTFTALMTGLASSTNYYVKAYAHNSKGYSYGIMRSFTSGSYTYATLTTDTVTSILGTTATSGGNITSDGGDAVVERGICWNTGGSPTTSDSIYTDDNSGTGTYSGYMIGLTQGTTYYVRAYAINSAGTAYGNQRSFQTLSLASVTTYDASEIGTTEATSGGNVTSDGGTTVTAYGVCWNTGGSPTTANSKTVDGSGTGSFISYLTVLSPGTTYYIRAYATNSAGTKYGSQVSFQTTTTTPTVTTSGATNIHDTYATLGGEVTATGGATVDERGICWSTSSNPTVLGSHAAVGSGTGVFSTTLPVSTLLSDTIYHIRAYAHNSNGTAYGSDLTFRTQIPA